MRTSFLSGTRIGDYVVIQKAGDVIPEIVRPRQNGAQGRNPVAMPSECPVSAVRRAPPRAATVREQGLPQQRSHHPLCIQGPWTSRGWGQRSINHSGRACEARQTYWLKKEDLPGARTLWRSRRTLLTLLPGKDRPLARLIFALGIRLVGAEVARELANHFQYP